jgi:hypothetical protein
MNAPTESKPEGPSEGKWAPGAEPLAICMSCSSTYPPDTPECPNCMVSLSVVRKCPSCGRVQSAQHFACIYCANSFVREEGLRPLASGPLSRKRQLSQQRFRIVAGVALAVGVAAGLALHFSRRSPGKAPAVIAQTYVLHATSMRANASLDAPPIKDLQGSEILNITGYTIDMMGNRWFRVTTQDVTGYLSAQDVAPPKATDPEKGFEALRHWLLGVDDPSTLGEAEKAVEYYRNTYPASSHGDEARWLLAERIRTLAEASNLPPDLLASAREQYQQLAQAGGEYADRARQALEQLPTDLRSRPPRRSGQPSTLDFSVVGGAVTSSRSSPGASPGAPIRRVTVLSRTPLYVRLTSPAQLSTGKAFEAQFAQDIWVNKEIAVPRGSTARIAVSEAGGTPSLRIIAVVISGETYPVSASVSRIESTDRRAIRGPIPSTLPAGTHIEFRLDASLVVTHR